jgi:hypothetical protein
VPYVHLVSLAHAGRLGHAVTGYIAGHVRRARRHKRNSLIRSGCPYCRVRDSHRCLESWLYSAIAGTTTATIRHCQDNRRSGARPASRARFHRRRTRRRDGRAPPVCVGGPGRLTGYLALFRRDPMAQEVRGRNRESPVPCQHESPIPGGTSRRNHRRSVRIGSCGRFRAAKRGSPCR